MAFDVLRSAENGEFIQRPGSDVPMFTFFSQPDNRYVRVTTRDEGDADSPYATVQEAVQVINNLASIPEVVIRNDSWTTNLTKNFFFDYRGRPRASTSPISKLRNSIDEQATTINLNLLSDLVDDAQDGASREEFNQMFSLIRSLDVSTLDDLNYVQSTPSIPTESILNPDGLMEMDTEDLNDLLRDVPELEQFIDFGRIASVTQANIDAAISGIADLRSKLGIDFATPGTSIPSGIGDRIQAIPNLSEYFTETSLTGRRLFPNEANDVNVLRSNFEFFRSDSKFLSDDNLENMDRLDTLIEEGRITYHPLIDIIPEIIAKIEPAENVLNVFTGVPSSGIIARLKNSVSSSVDGFGNTIPGLEEAFSSIKTHVERVIDIFPDDESININLDPDQTGLDIDNFISNPIVDLVGSTTAPKAQDLIAAAENIGSRVATLAKTIGDNDHIDEHFRAISLDTTMGLILSPTYVWFARLTLTTLCEITNFNPSQADLDQILNQYVLFESLIEKRVQLYNELPDAIGFYEAEKDLLNAIQQMKSYFNERKSGVLPRIADTSELRETLLIAQTSWIPQFLMFFRRTFTRTLLSEMQAYRRNFALVDRLNIFDRSRSSAQFLNTVGTPEMNQALDVPISNDDDALMTSVPLRRISDDDFPECFKIGKFVTSSVDRNPRRLRNYERDYLGQNVVINSQNIRDSLQSMAINILQPLKDAGFEFEILQGLRGFTRERREGNLNNSDHNYGLAVDIKLNDPSTTGLAAAYIKKYLPWNKLIVYHFNQNSFANTEAYIHITHYNLESHGWDKTWQNYPVGDGLCRTIGGNGVAIPCFNTGIETDAPLPFITPVTFDEATNIITFNTVDETRDIDLSSLVTQGLNFDTLTNILTLVNTNETFEVDLSSMLVQGLTFDNLTNILTLVNTNNTFDVDLSVLDIDDVIISAVLNPSTYLLTLGTDLGTSVTVDLTPLVYTPPATNDGTTIGGGGGGITSSGGAITVLPGGSATTYTVPASGVTHIWARGSDGTECAEGLFAVNPGDVWSISFGNAARVNNGAASQYIAAQDATNVSNVIGNDTGTAFTTPTAPACGTDAATLVPMG